MSDENETGGGNPSLDGWFYQCDVSVLAALDLLVVDRVAKVIQLEPANQEDIEAELDVPRVKASVVVRGQRLIVQAKLRRSGQWTPSSMRKLVEHGTKRPTALKLLEDENVKYVLVTSADVSGSLSSLQVNGFREPTSDDPLPSNVFPASHVNAAAGRFAVLAQFSPERLVERINALLLSPLCVPASKLGACREELRKVAMTGMRKGLAWQRGDVEAVIKSHGGSIPSERDSQFVKPTNWDANPDAIGGLGFEYEINGNTAPNTTSARHYLVAAGQTVGVIASATALPTLTATQTAPTAVASLTINKLEYWHKDHLGSLTATTDHTGAVTQRYAYDPFGKRRYVTGSYDEFGALVFDWSPNSNNGDARGFPRTTLPEMLGQGRVRVRQTRRSWFREIPTLLGLQR